MFPGILSLELTLFSPAWNWRRNGISKELETCNKAISLLDEKDSKWFKDRKTKVQEKIDKTKKWIQLKFL